MKTLSVALILLFSTVASAMSCHYRFTDRLAVTITMDDQFEPQDGTIEYDNANTCTRDENGQYMCTEIYAGKFAVKFKDITPEDTVGATHSKISWIAERNDLENPFNPKSALGKFIRNAKFMSAVIPEPNLTIMLGGKEYQMECRDSE